MRILITGIHGFVGTNLVECIKEEHTIYGLDIISPTKDGVVKTFSWEELDSGKIKDDNGNDICIDAIIHLAGKAHDTKNKSQADVYFKVNTELTKKIYDYALTHGVKKFLFFSSVKAAADSVSGHILTENVTPTPKGPYGESKIAAEEYILGNEQKCKAMGMDFYIIRPCMIHGPGNKGNLNLLYNVVSKRIPWPLGAYENKRSFTSIDNLCFVIKRMIAMQIPSGIYNMSDDEPLSTNELIEIICNGIGHKAHIWRLPCGFIDACAKVGGLLRLPLNPERLRKLTENYVVSNEKIKCALGIEKMPLRAAKGLEKTIDSFKNAKV